MRDSAPPARPNLLLVLVDCLRHDRAAGDAGGARIPALTALRDAGTWFTTAVSGASLTTPSVATLFTGRDPIRHGVRSLRGYRLPAGIDTLAGALADAGYCARAEVSGPLLPVTGLDRGFQEWNCREEGENVHSRFGPRLLRLVAGGLPAPWFLFLHLWELHRPRKVRPEFDRPDAGAGPYDRALSSLDPFLARLLDAAPPDTIVLLTGDHGEAIRATDEDPRYWRRVSRWRAREPRLDRRMRRRRDRDRRPPPPGEGPCHGFHVTEELIRVPLILRGAPFPAGVRIPDLVRHADVAPTLLDALGLPPLADTDGRSLMPLVRGEPLPPAPAWSEATGRALAGRGEWIAGVRTVEYKYARPLYGEPRREELYDLRADPAETRNLAALAPEALARMRAIFAELSARETASEGIAPGEAARLEDRLRDLGYLGDSA